MSKTIPIRCQEQVSASKRSYQGSKKRPVPYSHPDEKTTHQCKFNAQYLIKSIDLYVCGSHANGIDKSELTKLRKR